jgi:lipopolysaccharide/colanic/teichoic acid biosynthesis glycosyltransferase
LWNVLKGDMSLAGPRPALPDEVERYDNWQRRRLSMRPGLTSLWQIRPLKQPADFYEWMRMDLEYIDTWSLALDLKILLKSLVVIVIGRW